MSRLFNCCKLVRLGNFLAFLSAVALAGPPLLPAQHVFPNHAANSNLASNSAAQPGVSTATASTTQMKKIPPGTVLPVVLRTSFSFEDRKAGQILHGQIAQTVPLPDGTRIRRGTRIEGHIVEVTPASNGSPAKVSLRFDKLQMNGQWIPVMTNLRAIAGFMSIQEAQVPVEAPGEGSPYNWLPTRQIGGDSVYGKNGPVMSAENTSEVIGKSVNDGVLVRPSAKEGMHCRGTVDGNDHAQALWVFSANACGTYGIEYLQIVHAGRSAPEGTLVLASANPKLKLTSGDGLLLRVN